MGQSQFKFGRNYKLEIMKSSSSFSNLQSLIPLDSTDPRNYFVFGLPYTIDFDIQRNSYTSASSATIRIFNLSQTTRNSLAHDEYDFSNYQRIVLKAGYGAGPDFPMIFQGNVTKCQSVREGVDFITTIEAADGGFAQDNAVYDNAFPANTPRSLIIADMATSLTKFNLKVGSIGNYGLSTTPRGNSYSGDTFPLLCDLTGEGLFIDLETVNCLQDNEYIFFPDIPLITARSGLLGTPIRQQSFLTFELLFEPRVGIGKVIELNSSTGFNYDGFFKVASVHHKGMISDTQCGDLITSVGVPYLSGFIPLSPVQAL